MKNKCLIAAAVMIPFIAGSAAAEENFYKNILISDEIRQQDHVNAAKEGAAQLLDTQPVTLKGEIKQLERRNYNIDQMKQNFGTAPFGLVWGLNMNETRQLGVKLIPIEMKDYVNCFNIEDQPLKLDDFRRVSVVFGEDNRLWRVIAYSDFITNDTPEASKGLKLYQKYYELLAKKYGNAHQSYTAQVSNVDAAFPSGGEDVSPANNPNLLKNLQNGSAELFATFEGGDVGAALSLNVDGSGNSYIVIDYKNLKILKENEAKILEAL